LRDWIERIHADLDEATVDPRTWALAQLWAFIVFPIVGGLLGAYLWKTLVPAEDE